MNTISVGRAPSSHEWRSGFQPQHCTNQAWWPSPAIPALGRLRQEAQNHTQLGRSFKARLGSKRPPLVQPHVSQSPPGPFQRAWHIPFHAMNIDALLCPHRCEGSFWQRAKRLSKPPWLLRRSCPPYRLEGLEPRETLGRSSTEVAGNIFLCGESRLSEQRHQALVFDSGK